MVLGATVIPVLALSALGPGCGSTTVENDAGADATTEEQKPIVTVLHPDMPPLPGETSCEVTITTGIPVNKAIHVETCSHVDYATNPPSGGNHWPVWAAYTTYEVAVPRESYVHNLEHGAVVLLYKCDGKCPDVLAALADARDAVAGDPLCLQIPGGPIERVVTTPDPLLDAPVAATAWGATYTATCLDPESLNAFAKAHYGKGTEATCAQGKLYGDPNGGAPVCGDGGAGTGGSSGGTSGSGGAGGSGAGGAGTGGTGGTGGVGQDGG